MSCCRIDSPKTSSSKCASQTSSFSSVSEIFFDEGRQCNIYAGCDYGGKESCSYRGAETCTKDAAATRTHTHARTGAHAHAHVSMFKNFPWTTSNFSPHPCESRASRIQYLVLKARRNVADDNHLLQQQLLEAASSCSSSNNNDNNNNKQHAISFSPAAQQHRQRSAKSMMESALRRRLKDRARLVKITDSSSFKRLVF